MNLKYLRDRKTADETLQGFKDELERIDKQYYNELSVFLSVDLYAKLHNDMHWNKGEEKGA